MGTRPVNKSGIAPPMPGRGCRSPLHPLHARQKPYGDLTPMFSFGCGTENPKGLHMSFFRVGDQLESDIVLDEHCVGWENIAHGGIVSTILDETMGWAVIAFKRVFFVTRVIEVRYHRPTPIRVPLKAVARIHPKPALRGCRVRGILYDRHGTRLASAQAEMAYLSEKMQALLPESYRREMVRVFREIEQLPP